MCGELRMSLSTMSVWRVLESHQKKDKAFRHRFATWGFVAFNQVRTLNDSELQERLAAYNIHLTRERLDTISSNYVSAVALAEDLVAEQLEGEGALSNWPWMIITVLWERWMPNRPNIEMVVDALYNGYEMQERGEERICCELWIKAMKMIKGIKWGTMINRSRCRRFAPSMIADSNES